MGDTLIFGQLISVLVPNLFINALMRLAFLSFIFFKRYTFELCRHLANMFINQLTSYKWFDWCLRLSHQFGTILQFFFVRLNKILRQ